MRPMTTCDSASSLREMDPLFRRMSRNPFQGTLVELGGLVVLRTSESAESSAALLEEPDGLERSPPCRGVPPSYDGGCVGSAPPRLDPAGIVRMLDINEPSCARGQPDH